MTALTTASGIDNPCNHDALAYVGSMPIHRLRRWLGIEHIGQSFVFSGSLFDVDAEHCFLTHEK